MKNNYFTIEVIVKKESDSHLQYLSLDIFNNINWTSDISKAVKLNKWNRRFIYERLNNCKAIDDIALMKIRASYVLEKIENQW